MESQLALISLRTSLPMMLGCDEMEVFEMFGWDEKMQAKTVKYCLTGIAKDTYDVFSSSD